MKASALNVFLDAGGTAADFEKHWPELRARLIEQRTLDALGSVPSLIERKRRSGIYGGGF